MHGILEGKLDDFENKSEGCGKFYNNYKSYQKVFILFN